MQFAIDVCIILDSLKTRLAMTDHVILEVGFEKRKRGV